MSSYAPLSGVIDTFHTPFNNVYRSTENTQMSKIAVISNTSIRNELSSNRVDSTTTIELPQNVLLQNSVLVLKINKDDIKPKQVFERGWGYNAIRLIRFQVAGSGQTLELTGQALMVKNLADCESQGKVDRLMELAGKSYNGTVDDAPKDDLVAYINLYLPWGSVSSKRYLPYDASILYRPASITVELNEASKVCVQAKDVNELRFNQYKESYVLTKTQVLRTPSVMPSLFGVGTQGRYSYPYMYPQHQVVEGVVGKSNKSDRQSIDLRGFRSGNLQSIDVWLTRETLGGDVPLSDSAYSQLASYAPRNVRLLYGGQELYKSDDDSAQIFNLCDNEINLSWTSDVFDYVTTNTDLGDAKEKESSYLHIPIAQFNETVMTDLMQVGLDMISQNVQLYFTTPNPDTLEPVDTETPKRQPKWTVHMNYNMLASVSTSGGDTQLEFVSPKLIMGGRPLAIEQ